MTNKKGWVSLHRKMYDNPRSSDPNWVALWIYLLLHATHNKHETIFEGKRITLKSGQLITGRKQISLNIGLSESRVQRLLKTLEIEQQIEQQTTPRNRLITIKNWDIYQNAEQLSEQQLNNKRTTTEQQLNTYNNDNNDNNVNKVVASNEATPQKKAENFFNNLMENQNKAFEFLSDSLKEKISSLGPPGKLEVWEEFKKFHSYWTESNKSGTKVRWQMQKTFDINRRLLTWINNKNKWNTNNGYGIIDIQED